MADSMHFNLLSPRGDPPLRAEMSNLSHHSNLYAKVCLQATEHEAPHAPTFSHQDNSCQGGRMGSKTTKQYWPLKPLLAHFFSQLAIYITLQFPAQHSPCHEA